MITIWKFPIRVEDVQEVQMPATAEIKAVQMQDEQLCIWAIVNTDMALKPRKIHIFGTGHELKDAWGLDYIGTVQAYNGALIWHVFEKSR